MRAILVSVDYADLLSLTLRWNRHHFSEVMVVTSPTDHETIEIASHLLCRVYTTTSFWASGADFNKWKALEEGLDAFGRMDQREGIKRHKNDRSEPDGLYDGWLCLMDADVLWSREVPYLGSMLKPGNLYTPRRRMMEDISGLGIAHSIPHEREWVRYPLHPQQKEFAGYTQIFHESDPVLGPPPWHEIDWRHAGGADSVFQAKWDDMHKIRPPFEVLHLGRAGQNWCGRASPYTDGSTPSDSRYKLDTLRRYICGRTPGPDRFKGEKLPPGGPT